ncbi:MAG TPA: GT4 family glycosyltransferase PelF, partial [Planctomycetaceae bacterium]|nr:GT4 family glycosyltransferase PelF [Planctomycetaceae bacterium]
AAKLARVPETIHTRHGQRYDASEKETAKFRRLSRLVNRIVAVSEDSRQLTIAEGIRPEKTLTIVNGIDVEKFPYSGPAPAGPVVLVARLSPEKNVECLLRSVPEIVKVRPDFRLEIAGDGACREDLVALSAALELTNCVTFLGETRDIPSLLGRASLFVLPSLTEGVSLTLLEAMARGLPVVATDVGGNPEVVVDGETGLIVPSNDPSALAQAILRVLEDKCKSHQMGQAGRTRVEQHFDIRRMVKEYESLYSTVAVRKQHAREEST